MPRPANFNFIPITQLKVASNDPILVSYNKTNSTLLFSVKNPEVNQFVGKFAKFFIDTEKHSLGWKFLYEKDLRDLKGYFKVKEKIKNNKLSGLLLHVPKFATDLLKLKDTVKQNKLTVGKYKPEGLLEDTQYYYIIFNKS